MQHTDWRTKNKEHAPEWDGKRLGYSGMQKGKQSATGRDSIKSMAGDYMLAHFRFPKIFMKGIWKFPQSIRRETSYSEEETLSAKCSTCHSTQYSHHLALSTWCGASCQSKPTYLNVVGEESNFLSPRATHPLFGTNILWLDFIIDPLERSFCFYRGTWHQPHPTNTSLKPK